MIISKIYWSVTQVVSVSKLPLSLDVLWRLVWKKPPSLHPALCTQGKLSQAEVPPGHSYQVRKSCETSLVIPYDRGILEECIGPEMPRVCPTSRLRQLFLLICTGLFDCYESEHKNSQEAGLATVLTAATRNRSPSPDTHCTQVLQS